MNVMRCRARVWVVALFALCAIVGPALAQSDAVRVRAVVEPQQAYVGQPARLTIEIRGTTDVTRPTVDAVDGLDIRFQGGQDRSSSFVRIINGRRTERTTKSYVFQWRVTSDAPGTYTIPPIGVTAGGVKYTTEPARVRFVEPPTTEDMLLDVSVGREGAYVGEPVRVTIDWYFARRPENWRFAFPGLGESFDLASPASFEETRGETIKLRFMGREVTARQSETRIDGATYARVRIEQMLIPRQTGTIALEGVSVSAELVMREGFFREESRYFAAHADGVTLDVRALPNGGRPRHFNGLIGAYSISARASETSVRVGDPIEMTLSVEGPLVESVNPPALHLQRDLTRDFRVPEDPGLSEIEEGEKVWRFTIRPTSAEASAIPPIELPYFDTETGEYAIASTSAIPLEVRATRRVTLSDAEGAPVAPRVELEETGAGIAHNYVGGELLVDQRFTVMGALSQPTAIALTAGPFGFWAASAVFVAVRRRSVGSARERERRRAASIARREIAEAAGAGEMSGALYAYMGRKLDRAPAGLTPEACERALSDRDASLAKAMREVLETCDAASYAGMHAEHEGALRDRADRLVSDIERVWRAKR